MIVDEIEKTVTIESPIELLHRQIGFFGKSEEHTEAVYLSFLEEDGYREKDISLTFHPFSDFEEKEDLQAYMHFGKDKGIIFKENCFKIILSPLFHILWEKVLDCRIEVINEENTKKSKEEKFYSILDKIEKCTKNKSCKKCECRDYCVKSGIGKAQVQKNISELCQKTIL